MCFLATWWEVIRQCFLIFFECTHMIFQVGEKLFCWKFWGGAVATFVKVSPVASLLLLAEASVLVLDPWPEGQICQVWCVCRICLSILFDCLSYDTVWLFVLRYCLIPEAEGTDPAGRLILKVVSVFCHVLVESPGKNFLFRGRCIFKVVDSALVPYGLIGLIIRDQAFRVAVNTELLHHHRHHKHQHIVQHPPHPMLVYLAVFRLSVLQSVTQHL